MDDLLRVDDHLDLLGRQVKATPAGLDITSSALFIIVAGSPPVILRPMEKLGCAQASWGDRHGAKVAYARVRNGPPECGEQDVIHPPAQHAGIRMGRTSED